MVDPVVAKTKIFIDTHSIAMPVPSIPCKNK